MAGKTENRVRIGLDKPEWLPAKYFFAARVLTGLAIGMALSAYGTALMVTLSDILAGNGARIGEFLTLFIGAWVIKETLKRMTIRPAADPMEGFTLPTAPERG